MDDLYGGTYRMFTQIYNHSGIKFHYVDMNNLDNVTAVLNENTKMILGRNTYESINEVGDIAAIATITPKNILLAVDNTFASPYLQGHSIWELMWLCILQQKYLAGPLMLLRVL
jgi:cystathionine beta-lyase